MSRFLQLSYEVTQEAILELQPDFERHDLSQLLQDDTEEARALSQVLWDANTLSPFGERFLRWYEGEAPKDETPLSLEELKVYLVASVDFYGLRRALVPMDGPQLVDEPTPASLNLFEDATEEDSEVESEREVARAGESEEPLSDEEQPASPQAPDDAKLSLATAQPARAQARAQEHEVGDDNPEQSGLELIELTHAPLSPLEAQSQLVLKKKYLGYGKNSEGVMGYCGQLTLSRFDDRPLEAALECSNPLLFLSSTSVRGTRTVVTYWMPPAAFPQPGGHLVVESPEYRKVLSVSSLFPQSRTDFLSARYVAALLLAPAVLGLLYFGFVYLYSCHGIVSQVQQSFPEVYASALSGQGTVHFRAEGVGLYQLEIVPASESLQLIWASLLWLAPLAATKFFRHLSRTRRRAFSTLLATALALPSLGLLLLWSLQRQLFPILEHADFSPLDLRGFLPWGIPLNLIVASYLFLSVHGVWDRKIPSRELRILLPGALSLAYVATCFVLIFGRSWMS